MRILTQAFQSACQSSSGGVDYRANGTRGSRDLGAIVITIAIHTSSLDPLCNDSHRRGVRRRCRASNCRCHVALQKLFQGCISIYGKFSRNLAVKVKSRPSRQTLPVHPGDQPAPLLGADLPDRRVGLRPDELTTMQAAQADVLGQVERASHPAEGAAMPPPPLATNRSGAGLA